MHTITIPTCQADRLEAKLAKLAKLAKELGEEFSFTKEDVFVASTDGKEVKELKHLYTLSSLPKVSGWNVVAKVLSDGAPVIFGTCPEHFRNRSECDHCKQPRHRTKTFVLEQDGKYIQVGGKCLSNYFTPRFEAFLVEYEALREANGKGTQVYGVGALEFLAVACASIRQFGFRKAESIPSTADSVLDHFFGKHKSAIEVTEEDRVKAYKTVAWAWEKNAEGASGNYISNIRAILERDFVTYRLAGYLASAAYLANKQEQPKKESKFVGKIGERITVTVKVLDARGYSTQFGCSFSYRLEDTEGNRINWFTGTRLEVGETYTITATVKAHNETYKNTEITRGRVK